MLKRGSASHARVKSRVTISLWLKSTSVSSGRQLMVTTPSIIASTLVSGNGKLRASPKRAHPGTQTAYPLALPQLESHSCSRSDEPLALSQHHRQPSYRVNGSGACWKCESGTYLNVTGGSICAACLAETGSLAGSNAITDCICKHGFEGSDGAACGACAVGLFKAVNGSGQCPPCAAGTYLNKTAGSWHT
eukprot:714185-Rhodomonas_salina.4